MFKLTTADLDSAKAAIDHHGYSTLLPTPPEWQDLTTHWIDIRRHIRSLNLETYRPNEPIVVTVAKNEWSVRHVHLLHPQDLLIYTALTLILKGDIDSARSRKSERRSFSYRASKEKGRLYKSAKNTYRRYIECLKRKSRKKGSQAVAVTDIADLYASVSHAQLRRLLSATVQTRRSAKALELLISPFATSFMARSGHGIPTGPFASRLLAEIMLNDIDSYLISKKVDFVRWVDDLNVFAPSLAAAKEIVLDLAMWLYGNHGLTPQAAKTHFMDVESYRDQFLLTIDERLADKKELLAESLFDQGYALDDEDVEEVMDDVQVVALLEMLVDAMPDDGSIDHRVVGFVARRLAKVPLDLGVASVVLEVLVENIDRLVPVIEAVSRLVVALLAKTGAPKSVAKSLLKSLRRATVNHHAIWILTIFAGERRWRITDKLGKVWQDADCDAVRRFAALAIAETRGSLPLSPTEFEEASPLVRLALLRTQTERERKGLKLKDAFERAVP